MQADFSTRFVGGAFMAAALLMWGGWALMPVQIGTFFAPGDFAEVLAHYQLWIWTFRLHLFGMVITAIALMALCALVIQSPARVLVWPGATVAAAGMFVGAVGAAFYYHHGAWGALALEGQSAAQAAVFVEALRIDTEYVTCLVRFSRVFTGLGLVLLSWGLIRWRVLPVWLGWSAVAIGVSAMALTMLLPDDMELFLPLFHLQSLWLLVTGVLILRGALKLDPAV